MRSEKRGDYAPLMSGPTFPQWIEYVDDWRWTPMAYSVHIEQDGMHWALSEHFDPPAPAEVPHKGYPVLCVDADGIVLRLSSEAQLKECIRILSMKPLPSSLGLSARRGTGAGPNSHWLSRLPARIKDPSGEKEW